MDLIALLVVLWVLSKCLSGGGTCHINVTCLPLLAYETLCDAGGTLSYQDFVRHLAPRFDAQRVGLFQTRSGKAKQVIDDLLRTTRSVTKTDDGVVIVTRPLVFTDMSGKKSMEFALHPSGRGTVCRHFH